MLPNTFNELQLFTNRPRMLNTLMFPFLITIFRVNHLTERINMGNFSELSDLGYMLPVSPSYYSCILIASHDMIDIHQPAELMSR